MIRTRGVVVIPHRPGPTVSLALALFHRLEPERLFVIVSAYIDESGTHGSPVTILGGVVGRLGAMVIIRSTMEKAP